MKNRLSATVFLLVLSCRHGVLNSGSLLSCRGLGGLENKNSTSFLMFICTRCAVAGCRRL